MTSMTSAQQLQPIEVDEDILNDPHEHALKKEREVPLSKMQQKFVQMYVYQDLTNTECAHRAGYSHPTEVATQLLRHPKFAHVQAKIRQLQEGEQKKYEITFERVARDLQEIRDRAVEDGKYSAAVQAELGRAKLAGLMVEKKEIKHGRIDQMDRDEVEARLMKLIESNNLAPELASQLAPEEIPEEIPGDIIEGEIEIDPGSEEISPDETP
jgi:phage terminase small subunit